VLPRLGATHLPDDVVAVPLTGPTPYRSIHAVVRTGLADTAAVRTAVAALRACAAREPGGAAAA
jgi:DNA-binding transcriptional LysR family regulator